jgi:tRNA pseudouridine13 synthase
MFGSRTFAAKGQALAREQAVLQRFGFSDATFGKFGKLVSGTRRHALIYLEDLKQDWELEGLRLQFSLPSGCYATVLLREVMKTEVEEPEEPAMDEAQTEG